MLVLLFVALWFILRVVCLSVCYFVLVFFSPFSIAITSLGEERANLSAFRTFVRSVLVWICQFPLPLGVWEGLRFVIVALPGFFFYLFLHTHTGVVGWCEGVVYLTSFGRPTDIGLELGLQIKAEGKCFYFFCFFAFIPVPLSSVSLSFISSTISSISFLPFSGRRHKMTH